MAFTMEENAKRFKLNIDDAKYSAFHWDDVETKKQKTDYSWYVEMYTFEHGYIGLNIDDQWEGVSLSVLINKNYAMIGEGSRTHREQLIDLLEHLNKEE